MLFLCLFVGITGNNGKVREGKGMYGKGIFKAIEPPKKVSTFASIKKLMLNRVKASRRGEFSWR
jgi:hypothetical protein